MAIRLVFFRNQKPYKNNKYTIQFVLMSSFQRYLIWWPVKSLSIETAVSKCVNATCVNFPIVNVLVSFKPHFFSWLLFLFSYLSIFSWHWLLYFGIFSSITLKMFIWNWKICLQRQSYCRWHLKDRLGIPQSGSGLAGGWDDGLTEKG